MAIRGTIHKSLFNIELRESHQRFVKSWETFSTFMKIKDNCLERQQKFGENPKNIQILNQVNVCLKNFEKYVPDVYKGFAHRWNAFCQ